MAVVGNVLRSSGCKVVGPLMQRRVLSSLGLGAIDEQLRRDQTNVVGLKVSDTPFDARLHALRGQPGAALTADEIAHYLGTPDKAEDIYHLLRHLAENNRVARQSGAGPDTAYQTQ